MPRKPTRSLGPIPPTLPDRFVAKFTENPANGCWEWIRPGAKGYAWIRWRGATVPAHRLAYEILVGPIPQGLHIDHLCRNPRCVNPAHLEPVTPYENTMRGVGTGALNAVKTHCASGHAFTAENTYLRPGTDGDRDCMECRRERSREYQRRRRARLRAAGFTSRGTPR